MKINMETAFATVGAGVLLLFLGSKIANVGDTVDRIIASKWTAVALIVVGGFFVATQSKQMKGLL